MFLALHQRADTKHMITRLKRAKIAPAVHLACQPKTRAILPNGSMAAQQSARLRHQGTIMPNVFEMKFRVPLAGRPIQDFGRFHSGVLPKLLIPLTAVCMLYGAAPFPGLPIFGLHFGLTRPQPFLGAPSPGPFLRRCILGR